MSLPASFLVCKCQKLGGGGGGLGLGRAGNKSWAYWTPHVSVVAKDNDVKCYKTLRLICWSSVRYCIATTST